MATSEPVAFWWPRDVLSVSGGDTDTYLQGQLSQDVNAIAAGDAAWSFVLEPQGKVAAWFRLTRRDVNSYVVDVDAGFGEVVAERLNRFKLRTDVTVETLDWRVLSVKTDDPRSVPHDVVETAELGVAVTWPNFGGTDLLGPAIESGDIPVGDSSEFAARRIAAGLPQMGAELTANTIPAAAGVVDVSASFTKGCYTGQELVARIDSRGNNTPTSLHKITLAGVSAPEPGTDIVVDGAVAGAVTSAAVTSGGAVALGYIKRSVEAPATGSILVDGAPTDAQILPL